VKALFIRVARSLLGVRAEVAKHLAEIKLDQAFDGLVTGLKDKDVWCAEPWWHLPIQDARHPALKPLVKRRCQLPLRQLLSALGNCCGKPRREA